jgi:crotonobetainyl-CoA:carnitine CoA-transferase CaiB-like acyl-CoA transferase
MILGDMGAEVIKVEPPSGDETRGWGPPHAGDEAAYFLGVNRNKRSIVIDASTVEGKSNLEMLIRNCDILVDNFKVGTLDKWGFDDAWFAKHAGEVVRCSITGYGPSGPKAHLPGYDFVLQAETGLMSITGGAEDAPTKHGVAIVDITTGLYAAIAILGALHEKQKSGKGQKVSVSLYQSGLALLSNVASNYLVSRKPPHRYGNGHPNIVPYRTFDAADGQLALAIGNDGQFARFAEIAERPDWASDQRFSRNVQRVENRVMLDKMVAAVIATRGIAEWIEALRARGIPCGAVNSVDDALSDAQTIALEMVQSIRHPTAGEIDLVAPPFTMSRTPPSITAPPPLFGEHTKEILDGLDALAVKIAATDQRGNT